MRVLQFVTLSIAALGSAGPVAGEPAEPAGARSLAPMTADGRALGGAAPVILGDLEEGFEDAPFSGDLDGYEGWMVAPDGADFGFSSLLTGPDSFGARTPETFADQDAFVFAQAQSPRLGDAQPGAASLDVLIREAPGDAIFIDLINYDTGFRNARLFLQPGGAIEALDVNPENPDDPIGVLVPTGETWSVGEVLEIGFATLPDGKLSVLIDGEPALTVTNLSEQRAGDPGFNGVGVRVNEDGSGDGIVGFDNVRTNRFVPGPPSGDLDGDGDVDSFDLAILLNDWGEAR